MDNHQLLAQLPHALQHDLAAPLRQIRSFHELLQKRAADALDDQAREWLDFIGRSSALGQAMLAGLADLMLIEAGTDDFREVGADELATLTRDQSGLSCRLSADRRARVQVSDAIWCRAMTQLLANAREYGDTADPRLEISSGPGQLVFEFSDAGPGIEPAQWPTALRPFGRLGGCLGPDRIGMGLTLTWRILELHGGLLERRDLEVPGLHLGWSLPRVDTPQ